MINYVGANSDLQQTSRKLDLAEEKHFINLYQDMIYEAAQLPPKSFLTGIGKVESGVALSIVYSQFKALIKSLENIYLTKEKELIKKLYYFEYGKELKDYNLE
jgi:glucose uptake protein GlcU